MDVKGNRKNLNPGEGVDRSMGQMAPKARLLSFLAVVFLLTSVSGTARLPRIISSSEQEKPAEFQKWAADVDYLRTELPRQHKNLFFKFSEAEFLESAERFKNSLPSCNFNEFYVGLSRLIASIGDSHTSLRLQIKHAFPLILYWFPKGIYVINTTPEYQGILYGRVTAVNNHPIGEVIDSFSDIISHENEAQLRSSIPQILASAEHLHGLNILPDVGKTTLTVEDEQARIVSVDMKSMPVRGPLKGIVDMREDSAWPLYMRNRGQFYWFEYLPDVRTVYFKYNSCRSMPAVPFSQFSQQLLESIKSHPVDRLVVDLRSNGGGNSGILNPLINALAKNEKVNRKGRLFVIIGRRTFSSAILNALDLRTKTEAILIGEPTGGKPNHFGEIRSLTLPNTKLVVTYSTKYFQHATEDTPSLMPDITVEMSIEDYKDRRDPVLDSILTSKFRTPNT
jgi:hypothetical protein